MNPILGFAPDMDQTVPGVLSNCSNLIPYLNGMEGAPTAVNTPNVPPLANPCKGAGVVTKLDGTRRTFAGTFDTIYELVGGAWIDVSPTTFTGGADSIWSIAQFGNSTVMSNLVDSMQRSTTGNFSAIAGAPKAKIVYSVGSFVMALNTNDGAVKQDGWHCCAVNDETSWIPSSATQANSGRLVSTPGALTAGGALGEYAIAYKARSVYLGQYVGAPVVWDWTLIQTGEGGCVGQEAWCDIGGAHFFVAADNFFILTPSGATPIGDGYVKEWFVANSNPAFLYRTKCTYDRESGRVFVSYPSNSSETCNACIVYHVQSKKWGLMNLSVQAVLTYISAGYTINSLGSLAASIHGLPAIPYNSPFWSTGARTLSIFNGSNQLQSLTGECVTSSLTTGEAGDDDVLSLLQQFRLRFAQAPSAANVTTLSAKNSGEAFSVGPSGAMNDGKFDVLKAARWHKATVTFTGDVKVTHVNAKFKGAGKR